MSVGKVHTYGLDDQGLVVRFRKGSRNFIFSKMSGLFIGPTRPPVQRVPQSLPEEVKPPVA